MIYMSDIPPGGLIVLGLVGLSIYRLCKKEREPSDEDVSCAVKCSSQKIGVLKCRHWFNYTLL